MTENTKTKSSEYNKLKAGKHTKPNASKKPFVKSNKTSKVPVQIEEMVKIVKYNSNIRRHTSLNILHQFVEDGFIDEAKGAFVDFQWSKYTVKSNGITKEYQYDKTFVEALVKAHSDMAEDSTKVIAAFVEFANID